MAEVEEDMRKVLSAEEGALREEREEEVRPITMEELGNRINKLKLFMREVTGRTPKANSGLAHMKVKIDGSNIHNRIFEEDKITITPSYTTLEKKIA